MIIGLTGGSGTGKSTIVNFFLERGFIVLDFDKISRDICQVGMPCLNELSDNFGKEILNIDGSLNRKYLGNIVFSDKTKLELLNKITHKYIIKEMYRFLDTHKGKKIIFDAPLLFESKIDELCDYTIAVLAEKSIRIKRIINRDNISQEQAINRINSQQPDSFYKEKANIIINNNESIDDLYITLKRIIE